MLEVRSRTVTRNFIIARFAAGLAIVQAILAKADFHQRLAEAAIFFAVATLFRHLALHTTVLPVGRGRSHGRTVTRRTRSGKFRW